LVVDTTAPVQVSAVPLPPSQYRRLVLSFKKAAAGTEAAELAALGTPQAPLAHTVDPPPGEDGFEMIPLKYADVSEVVGLLANGIAVKSNDSFSPSEPGFGSQALAGGGGNNYTPAPAQDKSDSDPLGQAVDDSLAIDRRLNAIWVRGSPEHIARVKQEIALIDVPLDSVVLETQFVELTEIGQKALGIDFTNANGQIGVATFSSGGFIPSFGGPSGGHLVSTQFQAALYAQISKGNGRIVSAPRIAAQSGSTAKIITGDALPILTSIALSGVNGVSQQVQYVNVGVTLQIAPRVSNDGYVSSHVFAVVSSVTGYQQGYPTISQREAETSATVRDGDSFVIGGLTQDDVLNSKSKVPLLGDIPLIGQAFRTDKSSMSKTELYIVITPHIVHRVNSAVASTSEPVYAPTTTTQTLAMPAAAASGAHR
jgi:general secretion pathway protein D